ncbi:MAG: fatty-acid oxidation protein subunit alpha [Saprospiraceae bacterium]|nr:fatty-acid oxidation protein subunit alpha [Saprospiraceae bacterium]
MSRRDKVHDAVRFALEKEDWNVTDDPLAVQVGRKSAQIDIGAERVMGAERGGEKIAVEIKSFIGTSVLTEFYRALGQFRVYEAALKIQEPDRILYLAVPKNSYEELYEDVLRYVGFESLQVRMIIFDLENETPLQWIN